MRERERKVVVCRCACGRTYTHAEWSLLDLVGYQAEPEDEDDRPLELRNCPCGSTRAVEVRFT